MFFQLSFWDDTPEELKEKIESIEKETGKSFHLVSITPIAGDYRQSIMITYTLQDKENGPNSK